MPFVQGHLKDEPVAVTIATQCERTSRPIEIEIDSEMSFRILEGEEPLIFVPLVDFEKLKDPSIIHAF